MSRGTIDRISAPTEADFKNKYLRTGTPVIITDFVSKWPACGLWTPKYLAECTADRMFNVSVCTDKKLAGNNPKETPMRLADLVNDPSNYGKYYLQNLRLDALPEFTKDVFVPGYLDMKRFMGGSLWLGKDTGTPTHWHPMTEVFLCQVHGDKHFTMHSPQQFTSLHPRPFFAMDFNESESTHSPEKYPVDHVPSIDFTLHAGEMIYIPIHWWHLIVATDWSISVVYEWLADGQSRRFPRQTLHRAMAIALRLPQFLSGRAIRGYHNWIAPPDRSHYPVRRF